MFIEVGMTVNWASSIGGTQSAAIVTNVGDHSINVLVLPSGYHNGLPREARHITDEDVQRALDNDPECGVWEHTPLNQQIIELLGLDPPPAKEAPKGRKKEEVSV